ncbi:DoxX family membrane protein [uncultured Microbacterium sp.]|uniref:DoxX family membrane protein n=1 Tax=uncultured Microbacterium sp. TaxID=191216 RepID=UPI0025EE30C1|nr:DoxX family membrane protein [uncultured Microbacterium sp.]
MDAITSGATPVLVAIVLLLVRAALVVAFVREAAIKLKDVAAFAKNDAVPLPLAWFVTIAELAAALSLASGILARWAAIGVILLMLVTTGLHVFRWHSTYWAQKGGPEYDVLLLVLAAVVAVFGPGAIAIPLGG